MRQHGPLTTPDDLQRHNCLLYSHFASQHWQFSDAQGREASVAVNGNLSAGISSLLLEAAVAGCGIAMLPELEARGAIASGTLEVVLPEWTPKALSVTASIFPATTNLTDYRYFLMRCRGVWERRLATAESWRFAPRQHRRKAIPPVG